MKFKRTMNSKATIKKRKEYEFKDISEKDFKEGRKRKFKNQLFVDGKFNYYLIYSEKKKLIVTLLHSYDIFEEIKQGVKNE